MNDANSHAHWSRRQFVGSVSALAASTTIVPAATLATAASEAYDPQICVFTKPFNSLSFDQLAASVAKIGFDGIEAPIRKGGHVDLEKIEDELPKLVAALAIHKLVITLMTSDVNTVNRRTERILKSAANNGITNYRLQYFRYAPNVSIKKQLADWTAKLKDLAALNQSLGLVGLYQNHAGRNYFGGPLWDLADVLEDIGSEHLGVAYDIRHATVEGGMGWPVTLRRVMPLTKMLYVKDFQWSNLEASQQKNDSEALGGTNPRLTKKTPQKVVNVPLGNGQVDSRFLKMAIDAGFKGPISLHEEYLNHADPDLVPAHLKAMKKDFMELKTWL